METKKKPSVDLNLVRSLFLGIGILVSISIVSAAFEYKTGPSSLFHADLDFQEYEEFWCEFNIIIEADTVPKGEPIYMISEKEAEFPGGEKAWVSFLQKNLKPIRGAYKNGRKVFISFLVNKEGKLSDFTVVRSASPKLDKEALRVLALSPDWLPARQGDEVVHSRKMIVIQFPKYMEIVN